MCIGSAPGLVPHPVALTSIPSESFTNWFRETLEPKRISPLPIGGPTWRLMPSVYVMPHTVSSVPSGATPSVMGASSHTTCTPNGKPEG